MKDEFFEVAAPVYERAPQYSVNFQSRRRLFADAARRARSRTDRRPPLAVDLGCGPGALTADIRGEGFDVIAVDSSYAMIDRARSRDDLADVNFVCEDILMFLRRFEHRPDFVYSSSVFEYLTDPVEALRLVRSRMSAAGLFAISVPRRRSLSRLLERATLLNAPRYDRYTAHWNNSLLPSDYVREAAAVGFALQESASFGVLEVRRHRLLAQLERSPLVASMAFLLFAAD